MPTLAQETETRRAAERAGPSCHTDGTRGGAAFVDFQVTPHSRCGFPLAQLCHYTLASNEDGDDEPPERLSLGFPTADVVIFGARLGKLVELIQEQSLAAVMPLDARYAETLGKRPWVAEIVIARIDKSGGVAG